LRPPASGVSSGRTDRMSEFVNISAYKFTPLDELPPLRERLLKACRAAELRGTILLSAEGINVFVCGTRGNIDLLLATIRGIPGLADLTPKESLSAEQPFRRMLVKIKKEIIAFGVAGVDPAQRPSRKLSPGTLKQWLDEGRPVTLLDTRNNYEVRKGTFRGAVVPKIDRFRDFPAAVRHLPEEMKERPVVMFCTGGIRCEKAGPYLEMVGFKDVHQLDGGILKYFQECGGAHFDGECFVFDEREGVDHALREAKSAS
jgi:UPF0176 protein